jgi:hypothetical protein
MSKPSKIHDYYVLVYHPGHPANVGDGYVPEQILVAEKELGRFLFPDESVRHKNGDTQDNRLSNLEVVSASHGYKIVNLGDEHIESRKSSSKTFMPCKFQKPCWNEVRAPIARREKVYLPYICSFQESGDVYKCSRFWGYIGKITEEEKKER